MKALALAALAMISIAGTAMADETAKPMWYGNDLYGHCNDNTLFGGQICRVYVMGIYDAMTAAQETGQDIAGSTVCNIARVSIGQMEDVAKRFLQQHPELRHYGAAYLVARALSEAFPCAPPAQLSQGR